MFTRYLKISISSLILLSSALLYSAEDDLADAIRLFRTGFPEQAYKKFEKIVDDDPTNTTALTYLGEIKFEKKDWGGAGDWFNKLLDVDKDNLLAHYYLGICYRESGKYKAFLLQKLDWSKSRQHFEAVFSKEPNFRDVFYQYAILLRYKKEFYDAVDRAEHQLDYSPKNTNVIVGVHHLYDLLLYYKNGDDLREWLSKRDGNRPKFYIGESYRREGQFQRADSIFTLLLKTSDQTISKTPLLLAKARLAYQTGDLAGCEEWYTKAVDLLQNPTDAALLFEDIKYVFSDEELDHYQKIYRLPEYQDFFRKFWLKRNPMPGSRPNQRIVEHFRRMLLCEDGYRYDGVRSWVNSPDKQRYLVYPKVFFLNDKFNDKGLIYLRHGEPHERAIDVSGQYGVMPSGVDQAATMSNESWLYYVPGSQEKRIFHFLVDENATGNNWQLTAILPLNLLENRLEWDVIYHRMYFAAQDNDVAELSSLEMQMARKSRTDVFTALSSDTHTWPEKISPISFPFYVSTFRGANNKTRYEIYYGLEGKELWPETKDYLDSLKVELGFTAFDKKWNEIYTSKMQKSHKELKEIIDSANVFVDQFAFEAVPQEMYMNLYIRMPERNGVGGFKFKYGYSIYAVKDLKLSMITLADSIGPAVEKSKFVKNDLMIVPNPKLTFSREKPFYTYFEVYNLRLDAGGRAEFDLEYKIQLIERAKQGFLSRFKGLFGGGKSEVSNKVERFSDSKTSAEYLALDLREQPAGSYELTIVATDKISNEQSESKINFILE